MVVSVADLVTELHANIDSIHNTLSSLDSTASAHYAELERLTHEREQQIAELRAAHEIAVKEAAIRRQKHAEELAEQTRREQEDLEAKRQREYEELLARRKSEDEERQRILQEKEEERLRTIQEEDDRKEAEKNERERSLQEKVEKELEMLEDEWERKAEEGRQALRELDERRKAINAEIQAALDAPTVIPPMIFRSRARTMKVLSNSTGVKSPIRETSKIEPIPERGVEECKIENFEAPPTDATPVVNGSKDVLAEEEAAPVKVPKDVEVTPGDHTSNIYVHEPEYENVESTDLEEVKDIDENSICEAALPIAAAEILETEGKYSHLKPLSPELVEHSKETFPRELEPSPEIPNQESHDAPLLEPKFTTAEYTIDNNKDDEIKPKHSLTEAEEHTQDIAHEHLEPASDLPNHDTHDEVLLPETEIPVIEVGNNSNEYSGNNPEHSVTEPEEHNKDISHDDPEPVSDLPYQENHDEEPLPGTGIPITEAMSDISENKEAEPEHKLIEAERHVEDISQGLEAASELQIKETHDTLSADTSISLHEHPIDGGENKDIEFEHSHTEPEICTTDNASQEDVEILRHGSFHTDQETQAEAKTEDSPAVDKPVTGSTILEYAHVTESPSLESTGDLEAELTKVAEDASDSQEPLIETENPFTECVILHEPDVSKPRDLEETVAEEPNAEQDPQQTIVNDAEDAHEPQDLECPTSDDHVDSQELHIKELDLNEGAGDDNHRPPTIGSSPVEHLHDHGDQLTEPQGLEIHSEASPSKELSAVENSIINKDRDILIETENEIAGKSPNHPVVEIEGETPEIEVHNSSCDIETTAEQSGAHCIENTLPAPEDEPLDELHALGDEDSNVIDSVPNARADLKVLDGTTMHGGTQISKDEESLENLLFAVQEFSAEIEAMNPPEHLDSKATETLPIQVSGEHVHSIAQHEVEQDSAKDIELGSALSNDSAIGMVVSDKSPDFEIDIHPQELASEKFEHKEEFPAENFYNIHQEVTGRNEDCEAHSLELPPSREPEYKDSALSTENAESESHESVPHSQIFYNIGVEEHKNISQTTPHASPENEKVSAQVEKAFPKDQDDTAINGSDPMLTAQEGAPHNSDFQEEILQITHKAYDEVPTNAPLEKEDSLSGDGSILNPEDKIEACETPNEDFEPILEKGEGSSAGDEAVRKELDRTLNPEILPNPHENATTAEISPIEAESKSRELAAETASVHLVHEKEEDAHFAEEPLLEEACTSEKLETHPRSNEDIELKETIAFEKELTPHGLIAEDVPAEVANQQVEEEDAKDPSLTVKEPLPNEVDNIEAPESHSMSHTDASTKDVSLVEEEPTPHDLIADGLPFEIVEQQVVEDFKDSPLHIVEPDSEEVCGVGIPEPYSMDYGDASTNDVSLIKENPTPHHSTLDDIPTGVMHDEVEGKKSKDNSTDDEYASATEDHDYEHKEITPIVVLNAAHDSPGDEVPAEDNIVSFSVSDGLIEEHAHDLPSVIEKFKAPGVYEEPQAQIDESKVEEVNILHNEHVEEASLHEVPVTAKEIVAVQVEKEAHPKSAEPALEKLSYDEHVKDAPFYESRIVVEDIEAHDVEKESYAHVSELEPGQVSAVSHEVIPQTGDIGDFLVQEPPAEIFDEPSTHTKKNLTNEELEHSQPLVHLEDGTINGELPLQETFDEPIAVAKEFDKESTHEDEPLLASHDLAEESLPRDVDNVNFAPNDETITRKDIEPEQAELIDVPTHGHGEHGFGPVIHPRSAHEEHILHEAESDPKLSNDGSAPSSHETAPVNEEVELEIPHNHISESLDSRQNVKESPSDIEIPVANSHEVLELEQKQDVTEEPDKLVVPKTEDTSDFDQQDDSGEPHLEYSESITKATEHDDSDSDSSDTVVMSTTSHTGYDGSRDEKIRDMYILEAPSTETQDLHHGVPLTPSETMTSESSLHKANSDINHLGGSNSIDVFRFVESATPGVELVDDNMDEGSLKDGAPLNGSTGPQDHELVSESTVETSLANRFAESPATVLNTDDLFEDDTDSDDSDSEEESDADGENEETEGDEDGETYDDSDGSDSEEEEDDSEGQGEELDEPVPVQSKVESSFPHVIQTMPSYEFGKPKMVDPFSEASHDQIDFSSSHRSSGLFASLVDTIKSDLPAVKQMVNRGEPRVVPGTSYRERAAKAGVPNAFQQTDTEEEVPFYDTFSDDHSTGPPTTQSKSLHVRSHTSDTLPSFDSYMHSDADSTASETPSSPFREFSQQEPRIASSNFHEQPSTDESRDLKSEAPLPLRAGFDPYGSSTYPKYITQKKSQTDLRSPARSPRSVRNDRFVSQSIVSPKGPYSSRGTPSPSSRRFSQPGNVRPSDLAPPSMSRSSTLSRRPSQDSLPSPTLKRAATTVTRTTSAPGPAPTASSSVYMSTSNSNSFSHKTRSLFEATSNATSALPAVTRPMSGYFSHDRSSPTSTPPPPPPKLQKKGSMASLRSRPSSLQEAGVIRKPSIEQKVDQETDLIMPRSFSDGKPSSPAFVTPPVGRSGSFSSQHRSTNQRKNSGSGIRNVENDLNVFTPRTDIRARTSNPSSKGSGKISSDRGLEDSVYNSSKGRGIEREKTLLLGAEMMDGGSVSVGGRRRS